MKGGMGTNGWLKGVRGCEVCFKRKYKYLWVIYSKRHYRTCSCSADVCREPIKPGIYVKGHYLNRSDDIAHRVASVVVAEP